MSDWTKDSWRKKPILQQPTYKSPELLEKCLEQVRALPPLVHSYEIKSLTKSLAKCCRGEMFLLQGGDCAERFSECTEDKLISKFKIMLQMSLVIIWGSKLPVCRLGRVAGQFAKPRSSPFEVIDGKKVPSYKGDNVNGFEPENREPDPNRLVQAYFHSAATLNYLRSLATSGVAGLYHADSWRLDNITTNDGKKEEYEQIVSRVTEGLDFLQTVAAPAPSGVNTVDLFTSHEGLLLNYEEAVTRRVKNVEYNLGAHFLWIGDRTRNLDDAHVEYFRGIGNPIGCKVGPTTEPAALAKLIKILNPNKIEGKLTLITRLGCKKVAELLPPLIKAVVESGIPVVWSCDPCHGNTKKSQGHKTRDYNDMLVEVIETFGVHQKMGTHLGGVHLELTGDDVTECLGGSNQVQTLSDKYETTCDPRLNYTQSLDMAFAIAKRLRERTLRKREEAKKKKQTQ